jgi:hypothetical protein
VGTVIPQVLISGFTSIIAQRQVAAKSNEVPAMAPLPARFDLRGAVVTADAMQGGPPL